MLHTFARVNLTGQPITVDATISSVATTIVKCTLINIAAIGRHAVTFLAQNQRPIATPAVVVRTFLNVFANVLLPNTIDTEIVPRITAATVVY